MTDRVERVDGQEAASVAGDLSLLLLQTVQQVIQRQEEQAGESFQMLLERVEDLFLRKSDLKALKSETVGLLADLIQSRFRRGFKAVVRRDGDDPANLVSFLMGTVFTAGALGELAQALDRVILEKCQPLDYTFAGKGHFIAVEEVLQLLATGHHKGVLVVEKPDNCVQLYIQHGHVAFVTPEKVTRRVIRGEGLKEYREIGVELAREAEERHDREGVPVYLTFLERGFFRECDFTAFLAEQGSELIYELIRESGECLYRWRSLDEVPDFVEKYDIKLPVLPILLEAHKQMDDWRMIRRIIPDMDTPIELSPNRFAAMAELALDASQIKILAMVGGETTVREMAEDAGIPPFEVACMLAEFAKVGIIVPPGGPQSLLDQPTTARESMEWALAALDANEDLDSLQHKAQVQRSLAQVFGEPEAEEPVPEEKDPSFALKFMRAARGAKRPSRRQR